MEALPRRTDGANLDRQFGGFEHRAENSAGKQFERFQSDVDRKQNLFPLGSQWPVRLIRIRFGIPQHLRSGEEQRAGIRVCISGAGWDCDRRIRPHPALRSRVEPDSRSKHSRCRRFTRSAAAFREAGCEENPARGHISERRARGFRNAWRDSHRSGREGRHPELDEFAGDCRPRSFVVARRQVHRVFFRRDRRVRAAYRAAERSRPCKEDRPGKSAGVLLLADMVS